MSDTAPTGLALYVVEEARTTARANIRRLVRLDIADGGVVGRANLLVRDADFFDHFGGEKFHGDRVIYTTEGGVVDLTTGKAVAEPCGTVMGVEGQSLVIREWNNDGAPRASTYQAVDLESFESRYLFPPGIWGLPGKRSPDLIRSVSHRSGGLLVHGLGGGSRLLTEGISAHRRPAGSGQAEPPIIWLDAERVLSQRRNGLLIVVDLNGDIRAEIDLRLGRDEIMPTHRPRLSFDLAGQVVYDCHTLFRVRPDDREWGRYEEEPLGHGFYIDSKSREEGGLPPAVRHLGRHLGEFRSDGSADACPGHLALSVRVGTRRMQPRELHIWSEQTGWQQINIKLNSIVGWLDKRGG
jgi:hypothetical protein